MREAEPGEGLADTPPLEQMRAIARGEGPRLPAAELIGMRLLAVDLHEATAEMDVGPQHLNRAGTLFGGILCDLTDLAMGAAYAGTLEEGEWFTTLELKINFLKAVRDGRLTAVARVVKRGRTIGLVESDVFEEGEKLVARASCTCMTLRG